MKTLIIFVLFAALFSATRGQLLTDSLFQLPVLGCSSLSPCELSDGSLWTVPLSLQVYAKISTLLLGVNLKLSTALHIGSLKLSGSALAPLTLTIKAGAVLTLEVDLNVDVGATLIVEGQVIVKGKVNIKGKVILRAGGSIVCDGSSSIDANAQVVVGVGCLLDLKGVLNVAGLLEVRADATLKINLALSIALSGSVSLKGCIAEINGKVTVTGELFIDLAAIVTLKLDLVIAAAGKVRIGLDVNLLIHGVCNITGTLNITANCLLTIYGDVNVVGKLIVAAVAEIKLHAKLWIGGTVSLKGCSLTAAALVTVKGVLFVKASATVTFNGGIVILLNAKVDVEAGALLVLRGDSSITGALILRVGGNLLCASGTVTVSHALSVSGNVKLFATLKLTGFVYTQVAGVLELHGGVLVCASIVIRSGAACKGHGVLVGIVTVEGLLSPSLTGTAVIAINGSLSLAATAKVEIHIAGVSLFAVVRVTGSVSLGGSLWAIFDGGFVPASNHHFTWLHFSSVSGSFAQVKSVPSSAIHLSLDIGKAHLVYVSL